jgi:hypothetical protein
MNLDLLSIPFFALLLSCSASDPKPAKVEDSTVGRQDVKPATIQLPGGEGGIGLDDLRYSARLGRVLVPGGRTGTLDLVDPDSLRVETIPGFGKKGAYQGGHGDGTTSVDEGAGFLFAIDRTAGKVFVVDPAAKSIVTGAPLAGGPDYVRFVASTRELWVTEPDGDQIEVFKLSEERSPRLERVATIAVPGGPESLVIDGKRDRAYTHLWEGTSVSIDLKQRTIAARWSNGCKGSRGIALDEERGFLLIACAEGRAAVLDVAHDGKLLSEAQTGTGVDIVDYDPGRGHLYVPAGKSATLTILGVSAQGKLSVLGTVPIVAGSHCATTDGKGHVFVGDPAAGRLLVVADEFPPSNR